MGKREVIYIASVVWLVVTKALINLADGQDAFDKFHAFFAFAVLTGYMVFSVVTR